MSYCVLADVQALNPKRPYDNSTTPTSTQVTSFIATIAAEIDITLAVRGYSVPVASPVSLVGRQGKRQARSTRALRE